MPTISRQNFYRTLWIQAAIPQAEGEDKVESIPVKYKPINKAWTDKWDAIIQQETADRNARLVALQAKVAESQAAHDKAAQEGVPVEQLPSIYDAREELAVIQREVDPLNLIFRQLADVLISTGWTDEAGQPIPPTVENLQQLDLEFIKEVFSSLEKKLAAPTN